jgi:hypothetical protein
MLVIRAAKNAKTRERRPTMAIATRPESPAGLATRTATAVAYIDDDHAIVVKTLPDDSLGIVDLPRRQPEDLSYLLRITEEIGPRRRVAILGPSPLRLELEREYVSMYRTPDLLVDVEAATNETAAHLIERLEEFSA